MMLNIGISPRTAEFWCARCVGCSPPYHKICAKHQGWNRADCLLLFTGLASWNQHVGPANQRFRCTILDGKGHLHLLKNGAMGGGHGTTITFAKNTSSAAYIRPQKIIDGSFRKVVVVGGLLPKRTTYSAICWPHISY